MLVGVPRGLPGPGGGLFSAVGFYNVQNGVLVGLDGPEGVGRVSEVHHHGQTQSIMRRAGRGRVTRLHAHHVHAAARTHTARTQLHATTCNPGDRRTPALTAHILNHNSQDATGAPSPVPRRKRHLGHSTHTEH